MYREREGMRRWACITRRPVEIVQGERKGIEGFDLRQSINASPQVDVPLETHTPRARSVPGAHDIMHAHHMWPDKLKVMTCVPDRNASRIQVIDGTLRGLLLFFSSFSSSAASPALPRQVAIFASPHC